MISTSMIHVFYNHVRGAPSVTGGREGAESREERRVR